jgi:cytochrome d ubiquinol oxidase subunit II
MNEAWFVLLTLMLIGYAVLDGFDLGVGALHLFVARTEAERETNINAIGPVWNGNEVWLLAAGGSMVAAFPVLYASGISGFYLPIMLVLWLLILRGVGIEFRHQVENTLWREAWDAVFCISSALLAVLFGVAVGNVLRGMPFDATGRFQGSFTLMLNPFALLGGLVGLSMLCMHGATYLAVKTEGDLQARARRIGAGMWYAVIALLLGVTAASFLVRPDFLTNFLHAPVLFVLTITGAAAAILVFLGLRNGKDRLAFQASSALIIAVLASVAAGLFPNLLPALYHNPHPGLDIYNAASPPDSLKTAMGVYLFGMAVVIGYMVVVYRIWSGKVNEHGGYSG